MAERDSQTPWSWYFRRVSILIILANGWKKMATLNNEVTKSFQSSSYWRMAESLGYRQIRYVRWMFQSSSYWRMAERKSGENNRTIKSQSFNPHHTGEWLKDTCHFNWWLCIVVVSILIILANGWKHKRTIPNSNHNTFQSSSYWRMAESKLITMKV